MADQPNKTDIFRNPGLLKIDLMLRGVRLDPSITRKGILLPEYNLSLNTKGNLNLVLPQDVYVSVPYQEQDVENSPYKLRFFRNKYYLTNKDKSLQVKLIPHPKFYHKQLKKGYLYKNFFSSYGSFFSLSLGGHRYLQSHLEGDDHHYIPSVEEVIHMLDDISKTEKIDVLAMSSWDTSKDDGGITQITPYLKAIKASFNILVFIEIHLPKDKKFMNQTYAVGADSVCYHLGDLCSHGEQSRLDECHQMSEDEEIDFLKYAVSIYPHGTILSHITMGSRPLHEVKKDIKKLCEIGVLPILTPEKREVLLKKNYPIEDLADLYRYVYEEAKKNKIKMNWFSKMGPFISPFEGHFFTQDKPYLKLALMNFYQSRWFGGNISVRLSNLRRNLRVKEVKKK